MKLIVIRFLPNFWHLFYILIRKLTLVNITINTIIHYTKELIKTIKQINFLATIVGTWAELVSTTMMINCHIFHPWKNLYKFSRKFTEPSTTPCNKLNFCPPWRLLLLQKPFSLQLHPSFSSSSSSSFSALLLAQVLPFGLGTQSRASAIRLLSISLSLLLGSSMGV